MNNRFDFVRSYVITEDVNEDDLLKRFKGVLWDWVQYHSGENRLAPPFDETAVARDWYMMYYKVVAQHE